MGDRHSRAEHLPAVRQATTGDGRRHGQGEQVSVRKPSGNLLLAQVAVSSCGKAAGCSLSWLAAAAAAEQLLLTRAQPAVPVSVSTSA